MKHTRTWRFPSIAACAKFLIKHHKSAMSAPKLVSRLIECSNHYHGRQTVRGYRIHILPLTDKPESWRPIPHYPGYEVSSYGRVLSLPRTTYRDTTPVHLSGRFIRQSVTYESYLRAPLNKKGHKKSFNVNDLVAMAFIPNPHHYTRTNHKDNDRLNNFVNNLEWCDQNYLVHYGHRTEKTYKPIKLIKDKQCHHFASLWSAAKYIKTHTQSHCNLHELHSWLSSCASKNTVYNHILGYRAYGDSKKHA